MKCVDEGAETEIFGSYNTDRASNLMIVFERCNTSLRTCKADDVIEKWLEFNYLVLLENKKVFKQDGFNDDKIRKESHIVWYALTPSASRTDYVRKILLADLELSDSVLFSGSID